MKFPSLAESVDWFMNRAMPRRSRKTAVACAAALALSGPASATWSIVVLNRETGEVAVATSTCLANFDISFAVPVVRVGVMAGAAQSFVDPQGRNKRRIYENSVREGATPQLLLDLVESLDGAFQIRQFGIVAFPGPPATFSGSGNFQVALGVTGQVGAYDYAIQGNILTGANVVLDCEAAFLSTGGDLGEKMIAAMEAARDAGGDGRCSCPSGTPLSCGSPPQNFQYASYNAVMVIARHGDVDNTGCNGTVGCVNGDYYLKLNYVGNAGSEEPIANLRRRYGDWRTALGGRPDHIQSEVVQSMPRLQADGVTASRVTVRLVDVDGAPLTTGGQTLSVISKSGEAVATAEDFVDHGDGTHSFDLVATLQQGAGRYAVVVDDGVRPVEMYPPIRVLSAAPRDLHLGRASYSASEGGTLPIVVNLSGVPGATAYRVLASLSGTSPQSIFGGVAVPLTRDRVFDFTASWSGAPPFTGNAGALDATGRATALLDLPAGVLQPFVGASFWFSAWSPTSPQAFATQPVSLLIEP